MSEKKRPSGLIETLKTGTLHGAIPTASTFALLEWVEHLEKSMEGMELAPVGTRELIKKLSEESGAWSETQELIPSVEMLNAIEDLSEILSRYPQTQAQQESKDYTQPITSRSVTEQGKTNTARVCKSCGNPENKHPYRHPFVAGEFRRPQPEKEGEG
jgi:hypothetical protein